MPIFISYSSKDQKTAEAICTAIENRGHPCWISSRDIGPGENFQTQIVRAIRHAKIMVLVFSAHANNSEEIKKELVLAGQSRLVVIPVRVEDVTPDEAFAYEFATRQWIDVFGDWEHAIGRVVHQIEAIIGEEEAAATPKPAEDQPAPSPAAPPPPTAPPAAPSAQAAPPPPPPAPRKSPMAAIRGGAAVIIVILAGLLAWQMWPKPGASPRATAPIGPVASNPSPAPAPSPPATSAPSTPGAPITIPPAPTPGAPQPAATPNDPLIAALASAAPGMSEQAQADHARAYRNATPHKALAVPPDSQSVRYIAGRPSAESARDGILELCQLEAGKPCLLIAVDDTPQPIPPDGKWQGQDMPRLRYTGEFDLARMPTIAPEVAERAEFAGYRGLAEPKAIAFHLAGRTRFFIGTGADQHAAEVDALKRCDNDERGARADFHECVLYATGNKVVFSQRSPQPLTAQAAGPPKTFRDCPNCPEMVVVPAGSFQMGAGPGENERYEVPMAEADRDEPQHKVTFAKPFALGKFDVTRGEFMEFARATGFRPRPGCQTVIGNQWVPQLRAEWEHPGFPQTDRDPVVCMNDFEINAYLDWLRQKTGKNYRLPSEAEWEYAQRGGTTTAFYWGDDAKDACAYENVGDEDYGAKYGISDPIPCKDGYSDLAPVGSFKPNPFGLYDMAGNIFVMTADCWNETYAGAPTDGSAWMSGDCLRRVVRKAAFGNPHPWMFRSADREAEGIIVRRNRFGFRVALSLP